jgi:hypothetical protein
MFIIIIIIKFKIISIKKHEWRFCMGSLESMIRCTSAFWFLSR